MSIHPEDGPSNRLDDADAVARERAMPVIWALLGLLVIALFSIALWA